MFYKNVSYSAKTFYGVTFQPGEIKDVGQYINDLFMIPVEKPISILSQSVIEAQQKPSSEKPKKEAHKIEEVESKEVVTEGESGVAEAFVDPPKESAKSSNNKEHK